MPKDHDIRSLRYPGGEIVCWAPEYAKRDLPLDDPEAATIILGLLQCEAMAPAPEFDVVPRMTGRYESARNRCCVNQAGYHMELWYTLGKQRPAVRYCADYHPTLGLFEVRHAGDLSAHFDPAASAPARSVPEGVLLVTGRTSFEIHWTDETKDRFERFSDRATLSDAAVANLRRAIDLAQHPTIEGLLSDEHAPISERKFQSLVKFVVKGLDDGHGRALQTYLQDLASIDVEGGMANRQAVFDALREIQGVLAAHTSKAFEDPGAAAQVAARIQPYLRDRKLALFNSSRFLERRTLHEWFQTVLAYRHYAILPAKVEIDAITDWLGVAEPAPRRYLVEADLTVIGLDVGLPFARALLNNPKLQVFIKRIVGKTVSKMLDRIQQYRWDWGTTLKEFRKKIEEQMMAGISRHILGLLEAHAGGRVMFGVMQVRSPEGSWEAVYNVIAAVAATGLGGASGARVGDKKGGSFSMFARGYAESREEWKPSSFPGRFTLFPGLMANDRDGNRTDDQMVWLLDGGGATGQLQIVFDEVSTKASSMDIGIGYGMVRDIDREDVIHYEHPPQPLVDYTTEHHQEDAVQFQLGSATLRTSGRQILRVFAANELASFRQPASRVAIEGFADRLGQRWYNTQLSAMRATNMAQALMDCLGADFVAKGVTRGHGEDVLASLGEAFFPDETGSEQWRRGFVVLDGRVAATLGTNDPTVRRKPK